MNPIIIDLIVAAPFALIVLLLLLWGHGRLRWPIRSTADRYAKDYLAEERSGSGKRAWSLASCHLAIVNDRLEAKKLEQRVSALEGDLRRLTHAHNRQENTMVEWDDKRDRQLKNLLGRLRKLEAATPSPATERATTDSLSDATEQEYTEATPPGYSRSVPGTINAGPAGHDSGSADLSAAST